MYLCVCGMVNGIVGWLVARRTFQIVIIILKPRETNGKPDTKENMEIIFTAKKCSISNLLIVVNTGKQ